MKKLLIVALFFVSAMQLEGFVEDNLEAFLSKEYDGYNYRYEKLEDDKDDKDSKFLLVHSVAKGNEPKIFLTGVGSHQDIDKMRECSMFLFFTNLEAKIIGKNIALNEKNKARYQECRQLGDDLRVAFEAHQVKK